MDHPSKIYNENGTLKQEYWLNEDSMFHREDGPAIINYDLYGKVHEEHWYINGKCHREDGPATISYYTNGKIQEEYWRIDGELHREDGPAHKEYLDSGKQISEYWFLKGLMTREDGPSFVMYSRVGKTDILWIINGIDVSDEVNEWIKKHNIPDWSEWSNKEKALFKLKYVK